MRGGEKLSLKGNWRLSPQQSSTCFMESRSFHGWFRGKKIWKDIFSVLLWSDIHLLAGYCKASFYPLGYIVYRSFRPEIKFRTLCEPPTQVVVSARISKVPPWHFSLPIIFSLLFALCKAEHCHCYRHNFAQLALSGSNSSECRSGVGYSVWGWIFSDIFEILRILVGF